MTSLSTGVSATLKVDGVDVQSFSHRKSLSPRRCNSINRENKNVVLDYSGRCSSGRNKNYSSDHRNGSVLYPDSMLNGDHFCRDSIGNDDAPSTKPDGHVKSCFNDSGFVATTLDESSKVVEIDRYIRLADFEAVRKQLTYLTHQVAELMRVLSIERCRCNICDTFMFRQTAFVMKNDKLPSPDCDISFDSRFMHSPSTVPTADPTTNVIVEHLSAVINDNRSNLDSVNENMKMIASSDSSLHVENEDLRVTTSPSRLGVVSASELGIDNVVGSDGGCALSDTKDDNDFCVSQGEDDEDEENRMFGDNNEPTSVGQYSLHQTRYSDVLPPQSFFSNGCLNVAAMAAAAHAFLRNGVNHVRRPAVGVDQLLPKLLAEQQQRCGNNGSTIIKTSMSAKDLSLLSLENDFETEKPSTLMLNKKSINPRVIVEPPQDVNEHTNIFAAMYPILSSNDVTTTKSPGKTANSDSPPLEAENLSTGGGRKRVYSEHHRRNGVTVLAHRRDDHDDVASSSFVDQSMKRRRLIDEVSERPFQPLSTTVDAQCSGDRTFFVSESPNSSSGVDIPRSSEIGSVTQDILQMNEHLVSLDSTPHDRDGRFNYLSALNPVLQAGLPLVMPGPKATTFFCTICSREFSNVYYKRHMIVHANSRPHVCDVCGKRFNERSNMMKHKQRLHDSSC